MSKKDRSRISKRANIKDVARESNFSISTISRVLNGKANEFRIAKSSQEIILETAKRLNYSPNYSAASLKSGRNKTIALSIPSLNNPFFAYLASDINACLRKEGYFTILGETNENLHEEEGILKSLFERNIEGLILVPSEDKHDHIIKLVDNGLPIVCVDRYYEGINLPYVSTNNYKGACMATEYLIESGHRDILCIQGVVNAVPNRERVRGFKDIMSKFGLNDKSISGNSYSVQNGYLETKLALQSPNRPTAIFSMSNTIALGCLRALGEENLKIPNDISLITFDDHPFLDFLESPLSCVVQPHADIASLAVKILFSIMNQERIETYQIQLDPTLRIRNSVKRL